MLTSINGSPYSITDMGQKLQNVMSGWGSSVPTFSSNMSPTQIQRAIQGGFLQPYQALQQPPQQPQAVSQTQTPAMLQNQYNRLAQQASNALNGGLLGYQPSQIQAAGNNPQTFNAPQGNFRNSFAGLQGLLGGGY